MPHRSGRSLLPSADTSAPGPVSSRRRCPAALAALQADGLVKELLVLPKTPLAANEALSSHYLEICAKPDTPWSRTTRELRESGPPPSWRFGAHGEMDCRIASRGPEMVKDVSAEGNRRHRQGAMQHRSANEGEGNDESDDDGAQHDLGGHHVQPVGIRIKSVARAVTKKVLEHEPLAHDRAYFIAHCLCKLSLARDVDPLEAAAQLGEELLVKGFAISEVTNFIDEVRACVAEQKIEQLAGAPQCSLADIGLVTSYEALEAKAMATADAFIDETCTPSYKDVVAAVDTKAGFGVAVNDCVTVMASLGQVTAALQDTKASVGNSQRDMITDDNGARLAMDIQDTQLWAEAVLDNVDGFKGQRYAKAQDFSERFVARSAHHSNEQKDAWDFLQTAKLQSNYTHNIRAQMNQAQEETQQLQESLAKRLEQRQDDKTAATAHLAELETKLQQLQTAERQNSQSLEQAAAHVFQGRRKLELAMLQLVADAAATHAEKLATDAEWKQDEEAELTEQVQKEVDAANELLQQNKRQALASFLQKEIGESEDRCAQLRRDIETAEDHRKQLASRAEQMEAYLRKNGQNWRVDLQTGLLTESQNRTTMPMELARAYLDSLSRRERRARRKDAHCDRRRLRCGGQTGQLLQSCFEISARAQSIEIPDDPYESAWHEKEAALEAAGLRAAAGAPDEFAVSSVVGVEESNANASVRGADAAVDSVGTSSREFRVPSRLLTWTGCVVRSTSLPSFARAAGVQHSTDSGVDSVGSICGLAGDTRWMQFRGHHMNSQRQDLRTVDGSFEFQERRRVFDWDWQREAWISLWDCSSYLLRREQRTPPQRCLGHDLLGDSLANETMLRLKSITENALRCTDGLDKLDLVIGNIAQLQYGIESEWTQEVSEELSDAEELLHITFGAMERQRLNVCLTIACLSRLAKRAGELHDDSAVLGDHAEDISFSAKVLAGCGAEGQAERKWCANAIANELQDAVLRAMRLRGYWRHLRTETDELLGPRGPLAAAEATPNLVTNELISAPRFLAELVMSRLSQHATGLITKLQEMERKLGKDQGEAGNRDHEERTSGDRSSKQPSRASSKQQSEAIADFVRSARSSGCGTPRTNSKESQYDERRLRRKTVVSGSKSESPTRTSGSGTEVAREPKEPSLGKKYTRMSPQGKQWNVQTDVMFQRIESGDDEDATPHFAGEAFDADLNSIAASLGRQISGQSDSNDTDIDKRFRTMQRAGTMLSDFPEHYTTCLSDQGSLELDDDDWSPRHQNGMSSGVSTSLDASPDAAPMLFVDDTVSGVYGPAWKFDRVAKENWLRNVAPRIGHLEPLLPRWGDKGMALPQEFAAQRLACASGKDARANNRSPSPSMRTPGVAGFGWGKTGRPPPYGTGSERTKFVRQSSARQKDDHEVCGDVSDDDSSAPDCTERPHPMKLLPRGWRRVSGATYDDVHEFDERALDEHIASLHEGVDVDLEELIRQPPTPWWIQDVMDRVQSQTPVSAAPPVAEEVESVRRESPSRDGVEQVVVDHTPTPTPPLLRGWIPAPSSSPDATRRTPPLPPGGASAAAALGFLPPAPTDGLQPKGGPPTIPGLKKPFPPRPRTAEAATGAGKRSPRHACQQQLSSADPARPESSAAVAPIARPDSITPIENSSLPCVVHHSDGQYMGKVSRPATATAKMDVLPRAPMLKWLPAKSGTKDSDMASVAVPSTSAATSVLKRSYVQQIRAATLAIEAAETKSHKRQARAGGGSVARVSLLGATSGADIPSEASMRSFGHDRSALRSQLQQLIA